MLRLDLEAVYGHPIPWSEVMSPSLPPIENLERDLKKAEEGDGPQGELLWQTVLHQSFFMARDVYLLLQADEKIVLRSSTAPSFSLMQPRCPLWSQQNSWRS